LEEQVHTSTRSLEKLPSPPQVLVSLLNAVSDSRIGLRDLAETIRRDTATTTRLLSIANSGYYQRSQSCDSVEDALKLLGMDTVKTLVVTAAIRQYFSQFDTGYERLVQRFWLRSLIAAHIAHALGSLTRYHSPPEAYLTALLADTGQLYLLSEHPESYAALWTRAGNDDQQLLESEKKTLNTTHCDVGAAILDRWHMDNFMSEAVRYHHEPTEQISNGHHLVKIINLSSDLSQLCEPSEQTLERAYQLFGLNESLTLEMRARIGKDVRGIAHQMGIQINADEEQDAQEGPDQAREHLGETLEQITRLDQLRTQLSASASQGTEAQVATIGKTLLIGLGIDRPILFLENKSQGTLEGFTITGSALRSEFNISLDLEQSVVVQCLKQQKLQSSMTESVDTSTLSLADRQLLRYCRQTALLCLPFQSQQSRGVLVAGASSTLLQQHERKRTFFQALVDDMAPLLVSQLRQGGPGLPEATPIRYTESQIRETLHEVSNPLSIINNYLDMLRMKLQDDNEAQKDISVLREEIDRVGSLLMRLRSPAETGSEQAADINNLIRDLTAVIDRSMCQTRGITLVLALDPAMPELQLDAAALKQVLTNLLKNAIEALPKGGKLQVGSRARVNNNGRNFREISIQDNGPGLPDDTLERLFKSANSEKGPPHDGLGLKIVKQLVDKMGGQIQCSTDSSGTRFSILLPVRSEESQDKP